MRRFFGFLIIGGFIGAAFWFYSFYISALNYQLDPDSNQSILVDIKKGSSAVQIADQLYERGLINSPFVFNLYLKRQGLTNQLKAGKLVMKKNLDLKGVIEALIEGRTDNIAATLLEGWTVKQIAEYMESLNLTTADDFLKCIETCEFAQEYLPKDSLEGYLFPDTYFVDIASYSDEKFIQRLINTFEFKLKDEWEAIENGQYSLNELVIMASIVEREERNKKEQATVAGVLWNRHENGIGLGADATVLYALGRTKGGLTYNDLQVNSPYNTRKFRGLPPTPIANPGLSSLLAAIYPKETDYFYYLHSPDGVIHYGRTLEEHNVNKRKYL